MYNRLNIGKPARVVTLIAISAALIFWSTFGTQSIQAQTFSVLHTFEDVDGALPAAGLTADRNGNLYGTTMFGGNVNCIVVDLFPGCGTVFKLAHTGSGWTFSDLYSFAGGTDGEEPYMAVTFGPDGNLYGTTGLGGYPCNYYGCGTVFKLQPPPTVCKSVSCPWRKTELYQFTGLSDGAGPAVGSLTFDARGNIYGTSGAESTLSPGEVVYELSPSGNNWNFNILYSFAYGVASPGGGVVFDSQGSLWGASLTGGISDCGYPPQYSDCGMLFSISPSQSGWTERTVFQFQSATGGTPYGNLLLDRAGNFYGTTSINGPSNGGGSVYELSASGGLFTVLHGFTGATSGGPLDGLVMDPAGNLYGTTDFGGANNRGSVFKLTPSSDGWIYSDLHDFTGGADGSNPVARVLLDSAGDIYGIANSGGNLTDCHLGCGVVWEITP